MYQPTVADTSLSKRKEKYPHIHRCTIVLVQRAVPVSFVSEIPRTYNRKMNRNKVTEKKYW